MFAFSLPIPVRKRVAACERTLEVGLLAAGTASAQAGSRVASTARSARMGACDRFIATDAFGLESGRALRGNGPGSGSSGHGRRAGSDPRQLLLRSDNRPAASARVGQGEPGRLVGVPVLGRPPVPANNSFTGRA